MKSKTKRILAFLCAVVLFVTAVFTENAMNQAQAEDSSTAEATSTEPTPVELYGFQNVTLNGLVSATDNSVMTDKEYASGEYTYKLNKDTHFDKKLFTALVEFTDSDMTYWWNNRICIGGTADKGWGLSVALTNNGESLLICDADGEKIAAPQINKTIEEGMVPQNKGEANFQADGFQHATSITKEVCIDGEWIIFKKFKFINSYRLIAIFT